MGACRQSGLYVQAVVSQFRDVASRGVQSLHRRTHRSYKAGHQQPARDELLRTKRSIFGYASLACSLAFWVLLALHLIPGFPRRIDLPFGGWVAIWVVAIVLALV